MAASTPKALILIHGVLFSTVRWLGLRHFGEAHLVLISYTQLLVKQRDMSKQLLVLTVATLLVTSGCTSLNMNPMKWDSPLFTTAAAQVGSPAWWKGQKHKAEFVPGEGYRVADVEGFFDEQGRPIQDKVAKVVKREKSQGLLQDVNVKASVDSFKNQVGLGPDQQQAKLTFEKAEDLFEREKYPAAAKQFKKAIAYLPDSGMAQEAMFQMAESQFFAHDYAKATETYDRLIQTNTNTKHLDKIIRRQFSIARYWEQHHQHEPHWPTTPNLLDNKRPLFDTLGRSVKIYENIRLNDPTGPLADDAIMATANSFFLRGRYNDADYHYELVRTEYPRSEHQFEAHILGLKCKLQKYQGPNYDGTPLLEAKLLVKQIKIQFSGKLNQEDRERLALDEASLQKQLAMRDWTLAKFYEDNGYNGSAKFYYAKVQRKFPGTPIANDAQQAYAALEGLPEQPKVKLESLINLLPENAERLAIAQVPLLKQDPSVSLASHPEPLGEADGKIILRSYTSENQ